MFTEYIHDSLYKNRFERYENGVSFNCDGIENLSYIKDKTIDLIIADLPYNNKCKEKWDKPIDLVLLWEQYNRIIKDNGAILLFGQTPFDKILGSSNIKMLRYEWIWEKTRATGSLNCNTHPMKKHENILVFYKKQPIFNPIKTEGHNPTNSAYKKAEIHNKHGFYNKLSNDYYYKGGNTDRYPVSILKFPLDKNRIHRTQKPIELYEYLIKTYTNKKSIILDNTSGSGTLGVACMDLEDRYFIMFEKDNEIFNNQTKRLREILF